MGGKRLFEYMKEEVSMTGEPLKLNIYDLTPVNVYTYWAGIGAFHSAVEAYGAEYAYGAHDHPTSGVFEVEPMQCPGFRFRKSLIIGTIWMGPEKFREFIEEIACEYTGDSYHLIYKNCNHFCDDVCMRLVHTSLPNWVNRLAKLGSMWSCFLPKSLQAHGFTSNIDFKPCNVDEDDDDGDDDDDDDDNDEDDSDMSIEAKCSPGMIRDQACNLAMVVPKRRHVISSAFLRSSFSDVIFPLDSWNESSLSRTHSSDRLTEDSVESIKKIT